MRKNLTLISALALLLTGAWASVASAATQTFKQSGDIKWDFLEADPYGSQLTVNGVSGDVTKVTVDFDDLDNSDRTNALSMLLQGPGGQTVRLMNNAGGNGGAFNINLLFDDAALSPLPAPLASAAFRPTDNDPADSMSAPAPPPPYGTALSVFNGVPANGTWKLFVQDNAIPGAGSLKAWSLNITTADGPGPDPNPDPVPNDVTLNLEAKKQKLSRKLALKVTASDAGTLALSGKARGSVAVKEGTSTVKARLDPGAFKKLKRAVEAGKKASAVVEGTLKADGQSADSSTTVKLRSR